jgi:hypothetical protein
VDGCEGLYVTPTLQGSRAGGTVAQAWATVLHFGDDGYRKMARDVHGVCLQIGAIVGAPGSPWRPTCAVVHAAADWTGITLCGSAVLITRLRAQWRGVRVGGGAWGRVDPGAAAARDARRGDRAHRHHGVRAVHHLPGGVAAWPFWRPFRLRFTYVTPVLVTKY